MNDHHQALKVELGIFRLQDPKSKLTLLRDADGYVFESSRLGKICVKITDCEDQTCNKLRNELIELS